MKEPELSVDYIANYMHFSRFYISHIFKNFTGISMKSYLSSKRLSLAKEYLANSDMKFNEIGYKIGIINSIYLSKWFIDNTKMSMSEYRKIHSKK